MPKPEVTFPSPARTNKCSILQYPLLNHINNAKSDHMPIEESIREMEGKISLLDNRKFIGLISLISIYSITWLGFLTHLILKSGGF